MTNGMKGIRTIRRIALAVVGVVVLAASVHAAMHLVMGGHVKKPAASEFGFGPRRSPSGLYMATLNAPTPLLVRRLQTVRLAITDSAGQPVDGAAISVNGGMPQHGHGLPTQPRVTRALGNGVYEVEGLKFNMGGWWELRFAIASEAGADTVVFNLDL